MTGENPFGAEKNFFGSPVSGGKILTNKGHKPIIVNGVEDHVHAFIGLNPAMALSDLVRDVKNNSTNFINDHHWIKGKFCWQEYRLIKSRGDHAKQVGLPIRPANF